MKTLIVLAALVFTSSFVFAQQNKWMKDEKNILTVTITKDATKAELLELKDKLWDTYQIKFECPKMQFNKDNRLQYLSLRVEMPTGEVGTVGTSFVAPNQVIGFHFDRNDDAYDIFGVWAK